MPFRSLFGALPPYLGGKRRLAPLIFATLGRHLPRESWSGLRFVDPMCGGGAVALLAKAYGFEVMASDVSERGAVIVAALIANSDTRLAAADLVALRQYGARRRASPAPERSEIAPARGAAVRDALALAEDCSEPRRSLLRLLGVHLYLRSFPMSLPSATDARAAAAGDYDRISPRRLGHYLRRRDVPLAELRRVARGINAGVLAGRGRALRGDARDVLAAESADVVFLDPPYAGTTGYDRAYRALDRLLGDDDRGGKPPTLDDVLDAARDAPWLVITYGGPDATLDSVTAPVERHRVVREALAVPYPHLRAIAKEETRAANREHIVVAERR